MHFRQFIVVVAVYATCFCGLVLNAQDKSLPTIERDGGLYYKYMTKEGESLYGIAKQMDWDYEKLVELNPGVSDRMKKGYVIIYPADTVKKAETENAVEASNIVESVEKTDLNSFTGVSTRNPLLGLDRNLLMEYTIQPDDEIQVVAANFNTTVRDIFFLNRGVSDAWFPEGMVIDILPGSKDRDSRMEMVTIKVKKGETAYKVSKNDTFESIALSHGIKADELREANPGKYSVAKGDKIVVPQFGYKREYQNVVFSDPRESSPEGRREIYREVSEYNRVNNKDGKYEVVVLTSVSAADMKRESDFLRGFLLGVNDINPRGKKVDIQIVDITEDKLGSSYMRQLRAERPDVIIAAFEKDFPEDLVIYAQQNGCRLVNVFDAKSEAFEINDEVFQILMPSGMMNEKIAENLYEKFGSKEVIFIEDDANDSDSYSSLFGAKLMENGIKFKSVGTVDALSALKLKSSGNYLVVSNANAKDDIEDVLTIVKSLKETYPSIRLSVVGRPTWIVYSDRLLQQYEECDTYIPSRFLYNNESAAAVEFNDKFNMVYNIAPVPSFPPYAMMGYDVANYFVNALLSNGDNFNRKPVIGGGLDISFDFKRISAHSGFVNSTLYWMHYSAAGIEGIIF